MQSVNKKRVVIAGSGYGGLKALGELAHRNDLEIILVDKNPYHYLQTDVYDFIANKTNVTDVAISLVTLTSYYCGKVEFVQGKIVHFDLANNKIVMENGDNIEYDYIVISVGSRTFFPPQIEGLHEYSHGIKSLRWAFLFKQKFEQAMHKKVEEEGHCSVSPDFNMVIGGAGLSGVEIAAAMSEYSQSFFKHSGYVCGGINVYLIEGAPSIMYGLDPYLIKTTEKKLKALGVKIITGAKIQKVNEHSVELSDGRIVQMNFMVWTGGIKASPVLESIDAPKNARHHLLVDEHFRVGEYKNAFAIGDCTETKNSNGKIIPPTAQLAEVGGVLVGKNISLMIDGKEAKHTTNEIDFKGVLVAVGGTDCVAFLMNKFRFSGLPAFLVKKMVCVGYKEPLVAKCKIGAKKCDIK
jgi:NADH dehydrogenase